MKQKRYVLKIDFDRQHNKRNITILKNRIIKVMTFLFSNRTTYRITIERSTNNHIHGIVKITTTAKLDDKDIIILQLLMNSDYKREMFNFLRVRAHVKNWNILFKKKEVV